MSAHIERCVAAAREAGLAIDVERFPQGTRTAADAAAAVGCPVAAIAKSIVLSGDTGPVLVLTSGANQVDYEKVARRVGATELRRATAEEARAATGYPIGGTAPFGHPTPLPVLFDIDLLTFPEVWAAAGMPDAVFRVDTNRLLAATGAQVAEVAQARS